MFSFPPCKGTSYKLDEIRKQSLRNSSFKELPRKNPDFPPDMAKHAEQQPAAGPGGQHLERICYSGFCID